MSEDNPTGAQGKIIVFGAKQIRRIWHDQQWFFSVVDIVGALTDSPNPRNYWNMMKAREAEQSEVQLSTLCVQLKLLSSDGKSYITDCVNTEAATTEIARNKDAQGLKPNKRAAREGGSVAGNARRQLEAKSSRKVITSANYLIDKPKPKLPATSE